MGKVLLILLVLFLIAIVGAAAFLLTLDVDKYRPQIVERIERAVGMPVALEKISLTWHNGVALGLQGLALQDAETNKSLLNLDSAKVALDLTPLLSRRIQVTTLYLERPVVRVVVRPDGKIQGFQTGKVQKAPPGTSAAPAAKPASDGTQEAGAAMAFFLGKVQIDSAEVFFRDESQAPPIETTIKDVDLQLRNVALNEPIDIDAKAALFSSHQNLHVTGTLRVGLKEQERRLSNIHGEINLGSLDFQEIARLAPAMAEGPNKASGQLTFDISSLILNADGLRNMLAEMHLTDGKVEMSGMAPAENIGADIFAQAGEVKIKNMNLNYGGGKVSANGTVNLKTASPLAALNIQIDKLPLENVMESTDPRAPSLKGILTAGFQGTFSTAYPLRTMAGEGKVILEEGRVENLNVLKEVFQKFSMIPGLTDSLMTRLPENYKERLREKHTYFESIQTPFAVQQGNLLLRKLDVRSESFALQGAGQLGLESQQLNAEAALFIEPNLSQALAESRSELQLLLNQQGVIQIPLLIRGKLPHVVPIPDPQFLASRLAQGVLANVFRKPEPAATPVPGGPSAVPAQGESAPPQRQKLPKGKDILGALLQSALAPQEDASGESSQSQSY
jgi:uncharacterized protein YhdP